MTNLKVFRADWEAAKKKFKQLGDKENVKFSEGVLHGLKAALASGEEPFNKKLNPKQAKFCPFTNECRGFNKMMCINGCEEFPPEG